MGFSSRYTRILFYLLIFSTLFFIARYNYVFYHTIIEFFAIFTGLSITLISAATLGLTQNKIFIKFGILYFFVAVIDFLHTLAYKGMGVFRGWTANQPTQFWIAGRLLETIGFFLILFFPKLKERIIFVACGALSALFIFTIWFGFFPDCFIEGSGLTPFKITMEYVMIGILFVTLLRVFKCGDSSILSFRKSVILAIIFTMLGELSFTLYTDVYGFFNFLGHVFRFISYLVILIGVIVGSLREPVKVLLTELDEEKERLKQMAHKDHLTGLYSRNFFNELIQKQVSTALRQIVPLSFLMIDVDDFKQTNDTFGHLVGDEVLRFIARNIASSIRASDIAARYGGDEFIVAFYNTTEQQALQIAERIREKIRNSNELGFGVDISYGVAQLNSGQDYMKTLQKADEAMYAMKKSKKMAS
ncbi:GGDEF domain-containing protein [Pseudothermotoga sp.]|uniref:sensor domain-containing diguanylate cyclase n=1 Tax=Pseudothermotoga sp. TaxID=2033661 RepID=UPI0031F60CF2